METMPGADILDIRDLDKRFEELSDDVASLDVDENEEFEALCALQDQFPHSLNAQGNDFEPVMVLDEYFETYAQELADDIGAIKKGAEWPYNHIDWEAAAEALRTDYTAYEYGGYTYWVR